ncbi:Coatomer subunit beta'-1 [Glycine soja]|nr:Coatomer subunit beta'-1 [Glycine soja]
MVQFACRLENTLNYGLERVWAIGYLKSSRRVVIGYDEGTIMVKLGREVPVASMDNSGKIIWSKHNEIQTVNIKSVGADVEVADGERLPLAVKELGTCDLYPQEKRSVRPTFSAERIFGGTLLAMCSNDFICFYDWAECRLIYRIDVNVKNLYWADSGDLVTIASDTSFYILKYNRDVVVSHLDSGRPVDDEGVEDAFELLHEMNERVRTGIWVGDCFIYNNSSWRLNYCVGGEVTTMFHLDRPMYLLGYLANQSRVYLIDKEFNVMGYTLLLSLIEYKTLVMRGDLERANEILPSIPKEHHNSNRIPEAALMARSYLPSKVSEIVAIWRKDLNKVNPKAAESLANPEEYPNLFEDWQVALAVESKAVETRNVYPPAEQYVNHADKSHITLVEAFRSMQIEEGEEHLENGDSTHELTERNGEEHYTEEQEEQNGEEGSQEEAVVVDADSTDGAVLVNGNEADEEWGTNNEGAPSA